MSTPLTVACLFVQGEYPYTVDWVVRLRRMVEHWIDRPFSFVCLTDRAGEVRSHGVAAVPILRRPGCFAYWTKLELFNPQREWGGRVLYLDLDVLIVGPLAPIIDYPAEFALTADPAFVGQKTVDRFGRKIVRRFNSSVMVWDGGTQTHLFERWSPVAAQRLSGDQDWTAEHAPDASGMPRAWFPRLSEVGAPPFPAEAKVILSKFPKNDVALQTMPWFGPLWGAA